jgi:hypothetical protein
MENPQPRHRRSVACVHDFAVPQHKLYGRVAQQGEGPMQGGSLRGGDLAYLMGAVIVDRFHYTDSDAAFSELSSVSSCNTVDIGARRII